MNTVQNQAQSFMPTHPAPGALAPIDKGNPPQQQKRERQEKCKIAEDLAMFLNSLFEEIWNHQRAEQLELRRMMVKASKYWDGKQAGYVSEQGIWVDAKKNPGETTYTDNQYQQMVLDCAKEMNNSRPTIECVSAVEDDPNYEKVARLVQKRIEVNRQMLLKSQQRQTENMYLLLNTVAYRYTYFDFNDCRHTDTPEFGQTQVSPDMDALTVCETCMRPRQIDEEVSEIGEVSTPCGNCGGMFVKELTPQQGQAEQITGYKKTPIGENKMGQPNPLGVYVLLTATCIRETPFIWWKQLVPRTILEDKFRDVEIPSTGIKTIEMHYQSSMAKEASNYGSAYMWLSQLQTKGSKFENLEDDQIWLDLAVYGRYVPQEETVLRNGKVIPAGRPLSESFPKGMYINKVDKTILDLFSEDKNRKWTHCPYNLRLNSMHGAGTNAALEDQDKHNDLICLKMANAFFNAVAKQFVRPQFIEGGQLSSDPIEVNQVWDAPEDKPLIGYVYDAAPTNPLSAEVYQDDKDTLQSMQYKLSAFSVSGTGAPDIQAAQKTASGFAMYRNTIAGAFAPNLALKSDNLDVEQGIQFVENEKEYWSREQWLKVAGEFGEEAVEILLKCDLRRDIIVKVVEDSYMPKTTTDKMMKLQMFGEAMTQASNALSAGMDAQVVQNMLAHAAKLFDVPANTFSWNREQDIQQSRIQKISMVVDFILQNGYPDITQDVAVLLLAANPLELQQQYQMAQQEAAATGDETALQEMLPIIQAIQLAIMVNVQADCPVDLFLDDHKAMIDAAMDWARTDKGVQASNLLRLAVHTRVQQHHTAMSNLAAYVAQQQMDSMPQPPQPQEDPNAQAAADEEKQLMIADKAADLENQQAERDNKLQMQREKQAHDKDMKERDIEHQENIKTVDAHLQREQSRQQQKAKTNAR